MDVPSGKARWAGIRRLTDELEPKLARAVLADLGALRSHLHPVLLARSIDRGAPLFVTAVLARAASTPLRLRRALSVVDEAFFAGGHVAAGALNASVAFHDASPYVVRAALQHGALMVTRVAGETRRGIAEIVARALKDSRSPREQAAFIFDLLGLTADQVRRVDFLTARAHQAGRSLEEVERLRALASVRLRHERALVIARTETISAANLGQQRLWEQLMREGVLPETTRKEWITTADDRRCGFCAALNGQMVPVREHSTSPRIGAVSHPALHPRCRCAMGIARRTALAPSRQVLPFVASLPPRLSASDKAAWLLKAGTRQRARRAA